MINGEPLSSNETIDDRPQSGEVIMTVKMLFHESVQIISSYVEATKYHVMVRTATAVIWSNCNSYIVMHEDMTTTHDNKLKVTCCSSITSGVAGPVLTLCSYMYATGSLLSIHTVEGYENYRWYMITFSQKATISIFGLFSHLISFIQYNHQDMLAQLYNC